MAHADNVTSPRTHAMRGNRVEQPEDKLVLVVDLDETLVYALRRDRQPPPALSPEEETPGLPELDSCTVNLTDESFEVLIRPGAVEFLSRMARIYTVYLYTMGTQSYVQQVLPTLDPGSEVFRPGQVCVWSPEHKRHIKDLARIGADERRVLVLDDALYAWRDHVPNLVLISRFVGDRRDSALHVLPQYFRQIHTTFFHRNVPDQQRDVRTILADLCSPLMARCELTFTGYKHATEQVMREEPVCQMASRFGARLAFAVRNTTTHLVVRDGGSALRNADVSQLPKVKQAVVLSANRPLEQDPIFVVSEQWLLACICSLWPVDEGPYQLVDADGLGGVMHAPVVTTTPAAVEDADAGPDAE